MLQVEEMVQEAVTKGARVELGGKRHERGGTFYEPTLLTNVSTNMRCVSEEIFGPIAPVVK